MEEPFFIFAEAILRPRPGGKSILDPNVQITSESLKQFNADPVKMKQCVQALKKAGFSVGNIDKMSIGIAAPLYLFQQVCQFSIVNTDSGLTKNGTEPLSTIDASQIKPEYTDLCESLAVIIICPPAQLAGLNPLPKTEKCKIYPHEIPKNLGVKDWESMKTIFKRRNRNRRPNKKIKIAVIDSGFFPHPYLLDNFPESKNISVIRDAFVTKVMMDKIERLFTISDFINKFRERVYKVVQYPVTQEEKALLRRIMDEVGLDASKYPISSDKIHATIKGIFEYMTWKIRIFHEWNRDNILSTDEHITYGHGTQVVANLLGIIGTFPDFEISVVESRRMPPNKFDLNRSIVKACSSTPDIVTCSIGTTETHDEDPDRRTFLHNISLAVDKGITFLFAAGNLKEKIGQTKSMQPQLDEVISVAGAYRDEVDGKIAASDFTQGYIVNPDDPARRRVVPDICGLCGPLDTTGEVNNGNNLILPAYVDGHGDWRYNGGSSFATPQVAGICALIKMVYPEATPGEMKEILKASGDRVTKGKFALEGNNDNLTGNERIGLVNITEAINEALNRSYSSKLKQTNKGR